MGLKREGRKERKGEFHRIDRIVFLLFRGVFDQSNPKPILSILSNSTLSNFAAEDKKQIKCSLSKECRFSSVTSILFSGTRAPIDAERLECGGERPPGNPDFPPGRDDS